MLPNEDMNELTSLIIAGDEAGVRTLLECNPSLAMTGAEIGATRQTAPSHFLGELGHYIYAGDTPLHIAAAAYWAGVVRCLVQYGADVNAQNRRGARPLHYAVDGRPGSHRWNPEAQGQTVIALIDLGADPDATNKDGVSPLHRAVRNRCSSAVAALLQGGADPNLPNRRGSAPLRLATIPAGRGGSGSPEAKAEQEKIVAMLQAAG
jgi:hypothetical protein